MEQVWQACLPPYSLASDKDLYFSFNRLCVSRGNRGGGVGVRKRCVCLSVTHLPTYTQTRTHNRTWGQKEAGREGVPERTAWTRDHSHPPSPSLHPVHRSISSSLHCGAGWVADGGGVWGDRAVTGQLRNDPGPAYLDRKSVV